MRNSFLVLLLANLGLAAWYGWFAEPSSVVGVVSRGESTNITLLSELAPLDRRVLGGGSGTETGEGSQAFGASLPGRCVTIGPYSELAQL